MENTKCSEPKGKDKPFIKTRDVLWYLVFAGFTINYMLRINLNIAIVSMAKAPSKNGSLSIPQCLEKGSGNSSFNASHWDKQTLQFHQNSSKFENATSAITSSPVYKKSPIYEWNEKEQGFVLGAFFWIHWLTQIPGGILAEKYGTKLIFGLANFTAIFLGFFIPYAASLGPFYLMALRITQGVIAGFSWPAMHGLTAKWIPPNERSKFVTAYLGSSFGVAVTYAAAGIIIERWGWEMVFYASGIIGSIWFVLWWLLVYDSPADHPRISQQEKEYILNSLGKSVEKHRGDVPWKEILTSKEVWLTLLAHAGGIWGMFTLLALTPTYFKLIHGLNIRSTGFLSGLPHLLRLITAYLFSQLGDYLLRSNKMSRTNVRKLATGICTIGQGFCMLGLAFSGCDQLAALVFSSSATAMHGTVSTGPLASIIDISPNFASIIMGVVNTFGTITGLLTPIVAGYLTFENQTIGQWQKIFWISSGILIVSGIFYTLFSSSKIQPWNSPKEKGAALKCELEALNKEGFEKNDKSADKDRKINMA